MSNFINAVKQQTNKSYTFNGAVTNFSTFNPCLDLFFVVGTASTHNFDDVVLLYTKAFGYNKELTTKIMLWARDVRQGAGRREIFKSYLDFLLQEDPVLYSKMRHLIPEIGRWDDLFTHKQITVGKSADLIDWDNDLCLKWLPREKSSKKDLARMIMQELGLSPRQYRVNITQHVKTPTVENRMCHREFGAINYEHVPSKAMLKYQNVFARQDTDRFQEYKDSLVKGTAKVNAGAVYPHNITKMYNHSWRHAINTVVEEMWKTLPNFMEGNTTTMIPVCDVSGSMTHPPIDDGCTPLDIATGLSLYIAEKNEGPFKDIVLEFSDEARIMEVPSGLSLSARLKILKKTEYYSTNFFNVFNTILQAAKKNHLTQDDMPQTILVLSDMEFNSVDRGHTNFEVIDAAYARDNYTRPNLVFWNINGRLGNCPVTQNDKGVVLVSGFSPSILKTVLAGELDPIKTMLKTVDIDRYSWE